jgi:luciferase family oxidoreductase group 1
MKLSIVDQCMVAEGSTAAETLRQTIALARAADKLGYHRYWVAEHHGMPLIAASAPEVLIAAIAQATARIRVGAGAVLLPHYSPFKVAEQFHTLATLFPGRIDLGVARAPGGDRVESFALSRRRDRTKYETDDFADQLVELLAHHERAFPADHPFHRLRLTPRAETPPETWLLGGSLWSASAAAQLAIPYAFAQFLSPRGAAEAIAYYCRHFAKGRRASAPRAMLAIGVVCAPTQAEAEHLAASARALRRSARTISQLVPTPEAALAEIVADPPPIDPPGSGPRYIVGDPGQVREGLEAAARSAGADELMIVTATHDPAARLRSYALLAEAFSLPTMPRYGERSSA